MKKLCVWSFLAITILGTALSGDADAQWRFRRGYDSYYGYPTYSYPAAYGSNSIVYTYAPSQYGYYYAPSPVQYSTYAPSTTQYGYYNSPAASTNTPPTTQYSYYYNPSNGASYSSYAPTPTITNSNSTSGTTKSSTGSRYYYDEGPNGRWYWSR
jgi:hypothetical protein